MTVEDAGVQASRWSCTAVALCSSEGLAASSGLLMVQLQEVGNGLVLLLGELDDGPARLHRRVHAGPRPHGAAQVSNGVVTRSERVWAAWRGQAGGHDRWRSVELKAFKNLTRRKMNVTNNYMNSNSPSILTQLSLILFFFS